MSVVQIIDSVELYIENTPPDNVSASQDAPLFMTTATSTQTVNGSDQTNLNQRGVAFYVAATTSVRATCTVRLNLQAKSPLSGNYFTIASVSLGSIDTTNDPTATTFNAPWIVYPGASGGNATVAGIPLPRTYRIQASITVQATSTAGAVLLAISQSRIV